MRKIILFILPLLPLLPLFSFSQGVQGDSYYGVATGTNSYSVSINAITKTTIYDGQTIKVKFPNGNTTASTLIVRGGGTIVYPVKDIEKQDGTSLANANITAGSELWLCYNSAFDSWQILGSILNSVTGYWEANGNDIYNNNSDGVGINTGLSPFSSQLFVNADSGKTGLEIATSNSMALSLLTGGGGIDMINTSVASPSFNYYSASDGLVGHSLGTGLQISSPVLVARFNQTGVLTANTTMVGASFEDNLTLAGFTSTGNQFQITSGNPSTRNMFVVSKQSSDVFKITSGGLTGIGTGTTIVAARLHTIGTGTTSATVNSRFANSSNTAILQVRDDRRLIYTDGNEGANKVLTSDANGVATWATPSGTPTLAQVLTAGRNADATGTINTSTGSPSVDLNSRFLHSSTGGAADLSINYDTRRLYGSLDRETANYGSGYLLDDAFTPSRITMFWKLFLLQDAGQGTSFDWNLRMLYDEAYNNKIDYRNDTLFGNWTNKGDLIVTEEIIQDDAYTRNQTVLLADDATYTITKGGAAGKVTVMCYENVGAASINGFIQFIFVAYPSSGAGILTQIAATDGINEAVTDSDGFLCAYMTGEDITIKNRLGGPRNIMIIINYF